MPRFRHYGNGRSLEVRVTKQLRTPAWNPSQGDILSPARRIIPTAGGYRRRLAFDKSYPGGNRSCISGMTHNGG